MNNPNEPTIVVHRGYWVTVDKQDAHYFDQQWSVKIDGPRLVYFSRRIKSKLLHLHREILRASLGCSDEDIVFADHIDGDALNNRRVNLRNVTELQSAWNRAAFRSSRVPFKGVTKRRNGFSVAIKIGGSSVHLGLFSTVREAALVFDVAARIVHGDYARLNVPTEDATEKYQGIVGTVNHAVLLVKQKRAFDELMQGCAVAPTATPLGG